MKKHRSITRMVLALVLLLTLVSSAAADSANRVTWYVIASGGGRSNSPNYTLDGTVGQTAPGLAHSQNYRLGSGFWYVTGMPEVVERLVFLPTVLKAYP
jgi:ABC-type glycerol-3-phosphate transport system substrate-binding protein